MAARTEIEAIIKLRDEFSAKVAKIDKRLGGLDKSLKRTKSSSAGFAGSLKKGAVQALAFGGAAGVAAITVSKMAQVFGKSVRNIISFEKSMVRIETLVGVARGEVDSMSDSVRKLSKSSGRGITELAEGMFQITSAGLRGQAAMSVLEAATAAARVGLGSVATIADIATSAMNAYGVANISAEEAVGVLLKTVREGKASPEELAASLGRIIPIAATMGVAFSEVSGIVASMTRIGFSSSEAVTSLRQGMVAILKPTAQAEDALKQVELSIEDVRDKLKQDGLLAALEELREKMTLDQFARFIGSTEALAGILGVTGARFQETAGIVDSTGDSFGELDKAVERVAETAADRAARFKAGWSGALDTLTEKFIEFSLAAADVAGGASTQTAQEAEAFELLRSSGNVDPFRDTVTGLGAARDAFLETREAFEGAIGLGTDAMAALAEVDQAAGIEAREIAAALIITMEEKAEADKLAAIETAAHMEAINSLADAMGPAGLQTEMDNVTDALLLLQERGESLKGEALLDLIEKSKEFKEVLGETTPEIEALTTAYDSRLAAAMAKATMSTDKLLKGSEPLVLEFVEMHSAVDRLLPQLEDTTTANDAFAASLATAADFAQTFGGSLSGLVSQLMAAGGALKGLAGGKGLMSNLGGLFSGAKKEAGGGILGSIAGIASLAGPISAMAGPAIAAITGLIGKLRDKTGSLMKDVSRDIGVEISKALAQSILDSGENAQLFLREIFAEGILGIDELAREAGDLFSMFEQGRISKGTLIRELEETIPLLIANMGDLGDQGAMSVARILTAAKEMGIEFEGLQELIQADFTEHTLAFMGLVGEKSIHRIQAAARELGIDFDFLLQKVQDTFAPSTLEELGKQFDIGTEAARELAAELGINVQTNLERMAATVGLTGKEFKALGAELEGSFGIPAEELAEFLKATGISAKELAESLNVDVVGGVGALGDEQSEANERLNEGAFLAERLRAALEGAARASGGIGFGGGIPLESFAHGGDRLFTKPTLALFGEDGPERVSFRPVGGGGHQLGREVASELGPRGGGGGGITIENVQLVLAPQGDILSTEEDLAARLEPAASRLIRTSPDIQARIEDVARRVV